ncbi:MAG: addiction module toxin RelE [Acidobacteria bacterium RIFCSPLOWO2_12_FULL_60_22]|nr:MAG: addiction module toxin RelE [Acidobacteria bacterium RIFCSPLOWO2_12_FULL_60_22]
MTWKVELLAQAERDLGKLDPENARRISRFLFERVARLDNPRSIGEALHGPRFGELWKYRVGDYRLICKIEDNRFLVLVVRIGHRRKIYR